MRQPQRLSLESLETRLAPALAIYGLGFVPKPAMTAQAITVDSSFQHIMKIDYPNQRRRSQTARSIIPARRSGKAVWLFIIS